MRLAHGSRLGSYELGSILGVGGMGEVYRARDTKLGRDVAIKVLPAAFSEDPQRIARFQREAQVLASLNHPHIGAIYGVEEASGREFLVLELVDGETLDKRIENGPLPVEDALAMAAQIGEALEAAHERGVIHRDLKPSNVALTADGQVKVLDFGLAKLTTTGTAADVPESMSPTITSPALVTGVGALLGTAGYMAPEQAKGREADTRSDVWSFGCVLFEMLTGTRAFEGEDVSDTLAAVLKSEPKWSALPSGLSPSVHTLLRSCLEKDRRQRLASISGALFVLKHNTSWSSLPTRVPHPVWWSRWVYGTLGLAALVAVALGSGWFGWNLRPDDPRANQVTRRPVRLPTGSQFTNPGRQLVTLAPDGSGFVYVADNRLYLLSRDQLTPRAIDGTGGTGDASPRGPFFSPDSQMIGYWAEGELRRISVHGGTPVPICKAENPTGASWSADGTIVFAQSNGVWQVPSEGGTPVSIMKIDPADITRVQSPQLLPGNRALLITVVTDALDKADIVIQRLNGGAGQIVAQGKDARYVSPGYLLYTVKGVLNARQFDASSATFTSGPISVNERIAQSPNPRTGPAYFSVSESGALVYITETGALSAPRTLVWVDPQSTETEIRAPARLYQYPRLSRDQTRIALDAGIGLDRNIFIWDLINGVESRLTDDANNGRSPTWDYRDQRIIFSSSRDPEGLAQLYSQSADTVSPAERLLASRAPIFPQSASPDGEWLVVRRPRAGQEGSADLMKLSLDRPDKLEELVATSSWEENGEISPSGHWLAYQSDRSGSGMEVYVRGFPDANAGGQRTISIGGGTEPLWSYDGSKLFYRATNGAVMRVDVRATATTFAPAGKPVEVLAGTKYRLGTPSNPFRTYDVARDGRFLMVKVPESVTEQDRATADIVWILNWLEELHQPAARRLGSPR